MFSGSTAEVNSSPRFNAYVKKPIYIYIQAALSISSKGSSAIVFTSVKNSLGVS